MVINLQYIHIPYHYMVHLKLMSCQLYLNKKIVKTPYSCKSLMIYPITTFRASVYPPVHAPDPRFLYNIYICFLIVHAFSCIHSFFHAVLTSRNIHLFTLVIVKTCLFLSFVMIPFMMEINCSVFRIPIACSCI